MCAHKPKRELVKNLKISIIFQLSSSSFRLFTGFSSKSVIYFVFFEFRTMSLFAINLPAESGKDAATSPMISPLIKKILHFAPYCSPNEFIPQPLEGFAYASIADSLYIFGGSDLSGQETADLYIFTLKSGKDFEPLFLKFGFYDEEFFYCYRMAKSGRSKRRRKTVASRSRRHDCLQPKIVFIRRH